MTYIEHIGIAVKDINTSVDVYEKLLNTICYKQEIIESQQVITAFFKTGNNKIELLQSTKPNSIIEKFIDKKGEGIHHIAFAVENIESEMMRLKKEGFVLLNETPVEGADNKLVCFLHPANTNGVLVELCQEKLR